MWVFQAQNMNELWFCSDWNGGNFTTNRLLTDRQTNDIQHTHQHCIIDKTDENVLIWTHRFIYANRMALLFEFLREFRRKLHFSMSNVRCVWNLVLFFCLISFKKNRNKTYFQINLLHYHKVVDSWISPQTLLELKERPKKSIEILEWFCLKNIFNQFCFTFCLGRCHSCHTSIQRESKYAKRARNASSFDDWRITILVLQNMDWCNLLQPIQLQSSWLVRSHRLCVCVSERVRERTSHLNTC